METKDYAKLIAAQNESARKLKIIGVQRELNVARRRRVAAAFATGFYACGLIVATCFSGIDPNEIFHAGIDALNSFDSLKELVQQITPAMWLSILGTIAAYTEFIRQSRNYRTANEEFYDIVNYEPTDYLKTVDSQAEQGRNK